MMIFTDRYGRNVSKTTIGDEDIYSVDGGLEMRFPEGWEDARALDTINAMAPAGWMPPADVG